MSKHAGRIANREDYDHTAESSRDLLKETKKLKDENEKLCKTLSNRNTELTDCRKKLLNTEQILKDKDTKIKALEKSLSSCRADSLILEEQNKTLKGKIDTLKGEKSELVTKLVCATGNTDTIETKIESEFESLKEQLVQEIADVKSQLKHSNDLFKSLSKASNDQICQHSDNRRQQNQNRNQGRAHNTHNPLSQRNSVANGTKSIFIAGDDTTSVLSPRIMSDADVSVKIRTHRNANVQAVKSSLLKTIDNNKEYVQSINAVVLHLGAGNIAASESAESITLEIRNTAEIIKKEHPECKILISSILPRRNDRLVNNSSQETNRLLQEMCQSHDFHFIDNNKNFLNSGKPNFSLFKDGSNLNRKGAKLLSQNIKEKICSVLGIQSRSEETAHNSHNSAVTSEKNLPAPEVHSNVDFRLSNAVQQNQQDFQRQIPTMQGIHQNRMLPPWMPFYPPWFPPHPQMQF